LAVEKNNCLLAVKKKKKNGIKPNLGYFHPWGVQLIFTILLMNMGNLILGGRNVSLYDILNIPKDLYLLVKKLTEEWQKLNRVMLFS
jgi:hypothetical protein